MGFQVANHHVEDTLPAVLDKLTHFTTLYIWVFSTANVQIVKAVDGTRFCSAIEIPSPNIRIVALVALQEG